MRLQEMNIKEEYNSRSNSRRVCAAVLAALVFALFAAAPPAIAGTVTYDYDDAGRLVEADYGNGTIGYEYDGAGNLLEKTNLVDVETATGTGSASFGTEEGAGATIKDLEAVAESALPEEGKPNIEFTHGFFSFNITGLAQGQTVNVTIELPADVPVGYLWWKVNTTAGNNTWYSLPIGDDDGDNIITIALTDGGAGDDDGAANGIVRDPGGPGGLPPVHNLDTGMNYTTIQAAIDDANTTGGHTLTVDPGTYSENVRVTKSLTIRSTSGDCSDTVVTAADSGEHVFNITADYVNITGLTVENATGSAMAGIYLYDADNCRVTENNVTNNENGIRLNTSSDTVIADNIVHNNFQFGIWIHNESNTNRVENNTVYNQTSCWNSLGIGIFENSEHNHIYNNTVHDNTIDNIKLWSDACYNTIEENRCYNSEYGILVTNDANHNRIIDNELYENDYGIGMGVINESWGFPSPVNNSVHDNRIHDNTKDGIFLDRTDNNSICDNNCSSNGQKGIHLNGSSNNTIYNNHFNNTHNAWDDGTNVWNITKTSGANIVSGSYLGGNYWSDYAGTDDDGDGLGDTELPYNCSGNITNGGDLHPLIPVDDPSSCYIATATYGTPLDRRIGVLRDFRDNALMTNPIGEAFVSTYYRTSPPIADALRGNDGLRTVTRVTLITPLVYLSKFALNGILLVFILGLAVGVLLLRERDRNGFLRSLLVGAGSILVFTAAIFSLGFIGYTIPVCAGVGAYLLPFVIPVSLGLAVGAVWKKRGRKGATSSSFHIL
jgi:parallel beta-helix repeat protein/YD repeat-containing protein